MKLKNILLVREKQNNEGENICVVLETQIGGKTSDKGNGMAFSFG